MNRLQDLIGRTDLLELAEGQNERQHGLDLIPILFASGLQSEAAQYCTEPRNRPRDPGTLAARMLEDMRAAIHGAQGGRFQYQIRNSDRSIGARLSGEIARVHGNDVFDRISYQPDAKLQAQFANYPPMRCPKAEAAGFRNDGTVEALVKRALETF